MKNFVADGNSIQIAAPSGGITGGTIVKVGSLIGVAVATAAEGEQVTIMLKGSYQDIPKGTGTAYAVGDTLYWDAANSVMTKTASGNTFAGYAYATAASGDAICSILLSH